jgi:hypothetical protein
MSIPVGAARLAPKAAATVPPAGQPQRTGGPGGPATAATAPRGCSSNCWPTRIRLPSPSPFQRARSLGLMPYLRAMAYRVSPGRTVWVAGRLVVAGGGAPAAGAGRGLPVSSSSQRNPPLQPASRATSNTGTSPARWHLGRLQASPRAGVTALPGSHHDRLVSRCPLGTARRRRVPVPRAARRFRCGCSGPGPGPPVDPPG